MDGRNAPMDRYFLSNGLDKLTALLTPWRIKWYSRSILVAIAVSIIIAVCGGKDASTLTGRLGGDYPAFYAAGRIIADGDWQELYSPQKQRQTQANLFPDGDASLLPFSYPPFVALAYYPLSLVNYRVSYLIHTLLMIAALILTIHLLGPLSPLIDRYNLTALALSLSFYPLFKAITGGQNTAILLLLIIGSWRLVAARREWLGGMILGLLFFKPQFAVPLIGLYILSGRWRVGLGSLLTALLLYCLSSWVLGPLWVVPWAKFSWRFSQIDAGVNSSNSVSLLGFFQAVAGTESHAAFILGGGMILVAASALGLLWITRGRRGNLTACLSITMPALALLSPHAMYYDSSLVLFPLAGLLASDSEKYLPVVILAWLFGFSQLGSKMMGFSPLFILLVLLNFLAVYALSVGPPEKAPEH